MLLSKNVGWCVFVLSSALLIFQSSVIAQNSHPYCDSAGADFDGDGWGWENSRSCIVRGTSADKSAGSTSTTNTNNGQYPACESAATDPDGDGFGFENGRSCLVSQQSSSSATGGGLPECQTNSDPDGDGFGFENGRSCVVSQQSSSSATSGGLPECQTNSDPDGDGFGFENGRSCVVSQQSSSSATSGGLSECQTNSDPDGDGFGWEGGRSCVVSGAAKETVAAKESGSELSIADITDVVLLTGQSNLLGSDTKFNAELDKPVAGVFAYTDQGWQVADLHQVWDINAHPGNHSLVTNKQPFNNMAMHFGKTLVKDNPSRVVAFIVASAPGRGIAHWDKGSTFYNFVANKVQTALQQIPHKYSVDGILWQQGENDWLYEGTSDPNATGFSSKDSYEFKNYYKIKLESVIRNFRNESWGRADTAFICGETRRATGVNRRLMALNTDSDQLTACVPATDLPKRESDPYGSHFSAEGLRKLGSRHAKKYLELTGG